MLISLLLLLLGALILYLGAEGLVRGAASIALRLKISTLVIGLTIVAMGTSMPELVVSLKSNLMQLGGLSLGNIVGSNIFNIAVILGISALIYPIRTHIQLIRFDTPLLIGISILFLLAFRDHTISRLEGLLFTLGLLVYLVATIMIAKKANQSKVEPIQLETVLPQLPRSLMGDLLYIGGGLILLILGSNLFIQNAIRIATWLHVSDAIIGLTIAAAGTSLPELATSVVAAVKKQADLALGNVIGSNIFNTIGIIGLTATCIPITTLNINLFDFYWMLGTSILLLPIISSRLAISRWEGALLLVSYLLYLMLKWLNI